MKSITRWNFTQNNNTKYINTDKKSNTCLLSNTKSAKSCKKVILFNHHQNSAPISALPFELQIEYPYADKTNKRSDVHPDNCTQINSKYPHCHCDSHDICKCHAQHQFTKDCQRK